MLDDALVRLDAMILLLQLTSFQTVAVVVVVMLTGISHTSPRDHIQSSTTSWIRQCGVNLCLGVTIDICKHAVMQQALNLIGSGIYMDNFRCKSTCRISYGYLYKARLKSNYN